MFGRITNLFEWVLRPWKVAEEWRWIADHRQRIIERQHQVIEKADRQIAALQKEIGELLAQLDGGSYS